jgi:putative tricarboxylic transport membrane protein
MNGTASIKGSRNINRGALIEGIIILILGVVAFSESIRLILEKDPTTVYDAIGPGYYVFFLSLLLLVAGVAHLMSNLRKRVIKSVFMKKGVRTKILSMIGTLALYLILIDVLGYLSSTLIFFLVEFRLAGVTSWRTTILMTLIVTAAYYFVFVEYCSMVFPRGIFY